MSEAPIARVAVVGLGGIAQAAHLPAIASRRNAQLVGVCDVDAERRENFAAPDGDVVVTSSVDALLERAEPDIVTIATPPASHVPIAIEAMEAGAWVLAEKPLCRSLAELDRLRAAEEATGNWCVTVSQFRYGSASRSLKRGLEQGRWGPAYAAAATTAWFRGDDYYAVPWRGRFETELGGVTISQAHHLIDLTCWLLGPWQSVVADARTVGRQIEVEDVSAAIVRFESGAVANLFSTVLSHRQHTDLAVHCRDATIELSTLYEPADAEWRLTVADDDTDVLPIEGASTPATHGTQFSSLLDAWFRGRRPELTVGEEREVVELFTSLYRAAREGRRIHRGEVQASDPDYHALAGGAAGGLHDG